MFASKQKKLQERIGEYQQAVADCLGKFQSSMQSYGRSGDRGQLRQDVAEVHRLESYADDVRQDIEVMMYSKALFPESRGDVLGLLEAMDRVPNQAEAVVASLLQQHILIPAELVEGIERLVDLGCRAGEVMLSAAGRLLENYVRATEIIGKIDELESQADMLEAELVESIFASNHDGFEKILLRDVVRNLSAICDRAENVGDRISIMVAKRGI